MISPDRPARDIHQIVEAIIEQLTTLPDSEVALKLEIDAEVPSGLDRSKVRTLMEKRHDTWFLGQGNSVELEHTLAFALISRRFWCDA
jgi:hypothetical protein